MSVVLETPTSSAIEAKLLPWARNSTNRSRSARSFIVSSIMPDYFPWFEDLLAGRIAAFCTGFWPSVTTVPSLATTDPAGGFGAGLCALLPPDIAGRFWATSVRASLRWICIWSVRYHNRLWSWLHRQDRPDLSVPCGDLRHKLVRPREQVREESLTGYQDKTLHLESFVFFCRLLKNKLLYVRIFSRTNFKPGSA